jgi:hypothetical protein
MVIWLLGDGSGGSEAIVASLIVGQRHHDELLCKV